MLGFAGGVMVAASFWSLLAPAIEISEELGYPGWLPPVAASLREARRCGCSTWRCLTCTPLWQRPRPTARRRRCGRTTLLVLAITLHNIPEGLAVGVAFGAMGAMPEATLAGAVALALGMGLQNSQKVSPSRCRCAARDCRAHAHSFYGQLSAIVEPVFAFIGALLVWAARPILPFALAFAAGAMIFVVVEETVPESQAFRQRRPRDDLAS